MDTPNQEMRRRIFRQELVNLKKHGYLTDSLFDVVGEAHHQYHLDLVEEQRKLDVEIVEQPTKPVVYVPKKPAKVKKVRTPEEIRERNITWLLNLGVIMLLIGGLFVATSNWETMSSAMKSGSIAAVSLLFYGFAYLSKRVLNIEKTAFAFTVLGSLFLPIFVLSLGWFGLLGSYLSITGQGKYYLGVLGSFLPLMVYLFFSHYLNSRLFVWFSYISLTVGVSFLLAAFKLPIDYFYLGMVIYNSLLVYSLYTLNKQERFPLFTKELAVFTQLNLVLSTVTMIFLFEDHVTNGFNILLTAVIYLSMIFVTGKKEYHFIFTTMLVYGAYQLIEHSILDAFGPILFALIGMGVLFIPRLIKLPDAFGKIFRLTSAVISILAFLYISVEGLVLRMGEASIVLMIAYFIIGSHFVYMCYLVKNRLFNYLSPVFYSAALFEMFSLLDKYLINIKFSIEIFSVGFLLFILFGSANFYSKLDVIRKSSRDVGIIFMVFGMINSQGYKEWLELGVILFLFSLVCYLVIKLEDRQMFREISMWILPVSIGLSLVSFNEEINVHFQIFLVKFGVTAGFVGGSITVLLFSMVWGKLGEIELKRNSFFISQLFYTAGIVLSFIAPIDTLWVRPGIILGGVLIYLFLFIEKNYKWVPYLISAATLLFYSTVMNSIEQQLKISNIFWSLMITSGAVLLFLISFFLLKRSRQLSLGFAWIGHLVYPISLLFTFFVYNEESIWSFIIAIIVYVSSFLLTKQDWQKYLFLYAIFSTIAGLTASGLNRVLSNYQDYQGFMLTSAMIAVIWFTMNRHYQKATMYYWVPYSIIGILYCLDSWPFYPSHYILTLLYIVTVLGFIHYLRWVLIPFIPLFLSLLAAISFINFTMWDITFDFLLICGIGIVVFFVGKLLYKQFVIQRGTKWPEVDVYSITSVLYFLYLYTFELENIWLDSIPGILVAVLVYFQRGRIRKDWSFYLPTIIALLLLEPYYSVTLRLDLPVLWEREILVLPLVLFVIFIRRSYNERFEKITGSIQWGVLILVALLLIQDGLASSTIYDAIILGTLSLISLLVGMFFRIKAYFLVGTGVLLLNVFLQTRPYWGNMPWWAYLLISGSTLIFVASYNEWHKQKKAKGEETFLSRWKAKLIQMWKEWK